MKGGTAVLLILVTGLGAYALGRQDAPRPQPATVTAPVAVMASLPPSAVIEARPVPAAVTPLAAPATAQPLPKPTQKQPVEAKRDEKPAIERDTKRKVEVVLTAAAIAALIIEASRAEYHTGGRPCACPDDRMRNGRACGSRSAYSRPGGAAPLCYPNDVSADMIQQYRSRLASR